MAGLVFVVVESYVHGIRPCTSRYSVRSPLVYMSEQTSSSVHSTIKPVQGDMH